MSDEGYIFHAYGSERYLQAAVASAATLRRHDRERPIAICCHQQHQERLRDHPAGKLFDQVLDLPEAHHSIVGFKHHLYRFTPFQRNLFVDSDMIWCRDPDPLWKQLSAYPFTATGLERADYFFGSRKGLDILPLFLTYQREKTMKRFGLTCLPRVQAGMIYLDDPVLGRQVCQMAEGFFDIRHQTHFHDRRNEGRSHSSCEWSMAVAMSRLGLPVFPWYQGYNSPQLDYVAPFVDHDPDFESVRCRYFPNPTLQRLQGFPNTWLAQRLIDLYSSIPGQGDYMEVTPFSLHFGFKRHKQPFWDFSDRHWSSYP